MNQNNVSNFFNTDYTTYASYDSTRKIASYVDGNKISARKVLYTILELNITESRKIDSIVAKCSDLTQYIHGQNSLVGVTVNLAQNFIGSNNIPYLDRDGMFGTRMNNTAASSRYIFTSQENYLRNIFIKDDDNIIEKLKFEGSIIEPKFFIPIIPLLLVNGSEGIAVGYAQKILPRNHKNLMKYIFGNKNKSLLLPHYNGFKGKITQITDKSFEICGIIKNINTTTYEITEVPINYSYAQYISVLDKLTESNIIVSYEDLCDPNLDKFKFIIKVKREQFTKFKKFTEYELLDTFKLIQRVTENYTCLNENNQIQVFDSIEQILEAYSTIRLKYYQIRKDYIISKLLEKLIQLKSKIIFINSVVNNIIDIKTIKKDELILFFDNNKDIVKINDSYDYLLNIKIWSLSNESRLSAMNELKKVADEYKVYSKLDILDMWKNEYIELCQNPKIN